MSKKIVALAVASLLASGTALADKKTVWYDVDAGSLSDTCLAGDLATADGALAAALSYVSVHVAAAAEFEVTWHGKNGAVFAIDLAGALTQGTLTFSVSGAGAAAEADGAAGAIAAASATYSFLPLKTAAAGSGAEAVAGADAGGIAASGAAAGSLNGMLSRVRVDAANITEFRGGLLMGGLQGSASGSFVSELAEVLTQAYALACADANVFANPPATCNSNGSLTPEVASAAAEAMAGAIGGSAVGIATVAHYKKLPGNKSTDIINLNTGAVAILGCAAGASASASAP